MQDTANVLKARVMLDNQGRSERQQNKNRIASVLPESGVPVT